MQYGIDEEQNAILAFANLANIVVHNSGFWVNKKFLHLGASPDGLIFDTSTRTLSAIVEIKCLKSLKEQSFVEWMKQGIPRNACVSISEGKLVLKRSHPYYYYQVQLQLLITEAQCCYFVLHSRVNEPHIEHIFSDTVTQKKIVEYTQNFWYRVLVPEYFLMRVPRELSPIIF